MKNNTKLPSAKAKSRTYAERFAATRRAPPYKKAPPKKPHNHMAEICEDAEDYAPKAAPAAVAALIRSGADARSLFDALCRVADEFDEPLESLVELGTLLDAWEARLPAGHRPADAPFWSNVAAVCGDVSEEMDELPCSIDFGIAQVLFGAIKNAAIAHLDDALASTDD